VIQDDDCWNEREEEGTNATPGYRRGWGTGIFVFLIDSRSWEGHLRWMTYPGSTALDMEDDAKPAEESWRESQMCRLADVEASVDEKARAVNDEDNCRSRCVYQGQKGKSCMIVEGRPTRGLPRVG
jgi:hypothetical protein